MIDLDPEKVLASPWLWDEKTLDWARKVIEERHSQGELPSLDDPPMVKDPEEVIQGFWVPTSPGETAATKNGSPT